MKFWKPVSYFIRSSIVSGFYNKSTYNNFLKRSDVQRLCNEYTCRCLRNQEKEAAWKFIEGEMNAVTTVDGLEKLQVEWSNVKNNCNKSAGNAIWLEITLECLIFLTLKISCFLNFWGRNCWNQRYCLLQIMHYLRQWILFTDLGSSSEI